MNRVVWQVVCGHRVARLRAVSFSAFGSKMKTRCNLAANVLGQAVLYAASCGL